MQPPSQQPDTPFLACQKPGYGAAERGFQESITPFSAIRNGISELGCHVLRGFKRGYRVSGTLKNRALEARLAAVVLAYFEWFRRE
jgi:hypothetical protein